VVSQFSYKGTLSRYLLLAQASAGRFTGCAMRPAELKALHRDNHLVRSVIIV
jgi:hypothetical protein